MSGVGDLAGRVVAGEPRAIARAITLAERGTSDAAALLERLRPRLGHARVIGVTGAPGVGKSTLVGACIAALRARGLTVGVVAVDPSSPISGGAVLGDRVRMGSHAADAGVFVRSLASRGDTGGLAPAAARAVDVLDAAGRDVVIVETVGAGQSEVDVAWLADACAVVCSPGLGDDVQALKAGILEIADVLVVNKADRPDAERTAAQLRAMLALRAPGRGEAPVLDTIATTGEGVEALVDALLERAAAGARDGAPRAALRARRLVAGAAAEIVRRRVERTDDAALDPIVADVGTGRATPEAAARAWLRAAGLADE